MKRIATIAAIALAGCSTAPAEQAQDEAPQAAMTSPVEQAPAPVAIEAAKAALAAEPKVKDMVYDGSGAVQWQVGVLDDGTPRVGYAQYLCGVLKEKGALAGRTHVRVVDVAKVAQGSDFRTASLGHVICETGDVVAP